MRSVLVLFFMISCLAYTKSFASEPFGMKIGEMKISDFKQKIRSSNSGRNSWSNGVMRTIPTSELKIDGLTKAIAVFDTNDTLVGLLLSFNKNKFDRLNAMAKQNYQIVNSKIPYVGDKSVVYKDGNTEIRISAPHMSFEMSMQFLDKSLVDAYTLGKTQEIQERQAKENSALFGDY